MSWGNLCLQIMKLMFYKNEAPPPGGGGIFNCFSIAEAFNLSAVKRVGSDTVFSGKSDEAISASDKKRVGSAKTCGGTKHGGLSCFAYIPRQETEVFAKRLC